MNNEELLNNAIEACESLKKSFYKIIIGKNSNETYIELHFANNSFFHLLGLQHLKDIHEFNNRPNPEREYLRLLKDDNSLRSKVLNSRYLTDAVISRFVALAKLENILDNNLETYYDKKSYYGGRINKIEFDYVFHVKYDNRILICYFIKSTKDDCYKMVSTFEQEEPNSHCNRSHTVLSKTKISLLTKESIEILKL